MHTKIIEVLSSTYPEPGCAVCKAALDFEFTFAFQPIVDVNARSIYAYEALVRGPNGEGAAEVLARVNDDNRYQFDQGCRIKSILLAQSLGMTARISINFLPNAVYQPELCIRTTIAAAEAANFPLDKIIFEVTEGEQMREPEKLLAIFRYYRDRGFATAIDDFGAGYAGLGLLTDFQPSLIKIDIKLVRDIDANPVKQAVVAGILVTTRLLGIEVIAEGVETAAEARWFKQNGISLMQGYYFARPGFESLPQVTNWDLAD
ncbi:EAL domain-containing protein (putative c-di-GMP-specific phosphodiesterase class I) [Actimicrobium sp. GrIS 1.19]|uniref:EAL domain-containing protein n=1 Tax=Actimicrobium sp. GrIS 1.19 TaxID=3071708 RepID=UPI002E013F2A|nr:EAL domain-containing protein (putative c-di-GMP-specific phosphodiesterase class I) [Actimicrobium sp. GrIS 1.19]